MFSALLCEYQDSCVYFNMRSCKVKSPTLRSNCAVSMEGGRSLGTVSGRLPPLQHSSFIIKSSSYCLAEPHNLSFSRTPHYHDLTSSFLSREHFFILFNLFCIYILNNGISSHHTPRHMES